MALADLGVCYFPEHWPEDEWPAQASAIAAMGIRLVRMGEFAWSRIEPARDEFHWTWLDRAIDLLHAHGLKVILCTPTACPPKWLVDEDPEILPADRHGRVRGFGSRRHYRFASDCYREHSRRICSALADRYGDHPAVVGWQLDNEYGCHDTTLSYAQDDLEHFRAWLRARYGSIEALNEAWGTMFWSQCYRDFQAIELPCGTVTEANPAHSLDYWRFASEQVVTFNRDQVGVLRKALPENRWLCHNFMGNFTDFDHYRVAADLDIATWDSYPLGFLDQGWFSPEEKDRYRRLGHPDWAAFHHDLYRGVGNGRMAVMEQQPGPVNWAASNAMPLPGAVAFWSMEAIAHGAEFVSYFRFRQNPRAQEQMHAALQLPDGSPAPAAAEVARLSAELAMLPEARDKRASVAVVFDYESCWATATQPHALGVHALESCFNFYRGLRTLGLDIDVIGPQQDFSGYELIALPAALFADDALVGKLRRSGAVCVIGPRCGSRDAPCTLPGMLPPGALQALIPLRVIAVDSIRPGSHRIVHGTSAGAAIERWYEAVDTELPPAMTGEDDTAFWYRQGDCHYLNGWVAHETLALIFAELLAGRGILPWRPPEDIRVRSRGKLIFAFNHGSSATPCAIPDAELILGEETIAPADYAVWEGEAEA